MSAIYPDLENASVFITGGGSGNGAALTDEVGATSIHKPLAIRCDVTDTAALHAAMDQAVAAHGPFKAVVNNAANDQRYDLADVTPEIWDSMQAINLKPYFFGCQKAATCMAPKGAIVNYTSTSYMIGSAALMPYATANAGISGLTRSLARDLGPQGIRVNAIAPGWVMTEKQERMWATPQAKAAFLDMQCLPDHMQPQDLVGPTLFLASDASTMMTGQTMVVDAGVVTTG